MDDLLPTTGFPEMEEDHRETMALIQTLQHAINANRRAEVGVALASLLAQITEHFTQEVRLMKASGYAKLAQHSEAHEIFLRDVVAFKTEFAQKGLTPGFCRWVAGRLVKWYRLHIMIHDVELGHFLVSKGMVKDGGRG